MERQPSHRKHDPRHDYRQSCIYHITIVVRNRCALLGKLEGIAEDRSVITSSEEADRAIDARVQYTPLGLQVSRCIRAIPAYGLKRGLDLQILALQVMDTHVHFVLYVRQPMEKETLGDLIRGLKTGCNKAYRQYCSGNGVPGSSSSETIDEGSGSSSNGPGNGVPGSSSSETIDEGSGSSSNGPGNGVPGSSSSESLGAVRPKNVGLFEADFDDTILYKRGQLKRMINYVHDNPYRKWVKVHHRNRFVPMRGVVIAGRSYDAIGNILLLGLRRHQVHVRSRFSDTERSQYMNDCVVHARCNYALVSPFISPAEKSVKEFCLNEGHSIIQLVSNGFSDFTSCPGELYEFCLNGQLLLLVPSEFPHQERPAPISRAECVLLNGRADEIVRG